ncbi:MAG: RluA family pseudouridine synthase [Planctomycetota bacterium]|nr:RluA family pseudouridine synthase [Planctomycetota bacterium]
MAEHLVVPAGRAGLELDEFLCLTFPFANKGFLRRQVREGSVSVDGSPARPSQRLRVDQVVTVDFLEEEIPVAPIAPEERVPILHEDERVLVVDKPAGLAVEPERWKRDAACLTGALLDEAVDRSGGVDEGGRPVEGSLDWRPRLVHRIDKDTSGCVLVAKDLSAERSLRAAFEDSSVRKDYLALVEGEWFEDEPRVIDRPIAPGQRRAGRMVIHASGRPSRTRVMAEERFRGYTLLRCNPLTGRTHQIRVHLSEEGFPLVVDPMYGRNDQLLLSQFKPGYRPKRGASERPLLDRLALHAWRITFPDLTVPEGAGPRTITVESPVPADLERVLKQMRKVRAPRR